MFQAELSEEERLEKMKNRTKWQRFKIYLRRLLITIIVMGLLAVSIYAIIKAVEVSQDVVSFFFLGMQYPIISESCVVCMPCLLL